METSTTQKTNKAPHTQFQVTVETQYVTAESKPESGYHLFAYRVSIENKGKTAAQLLSRHWIITDEFGQTEEVRGAGVVGLQPKINPGQSFQYDSACPLNTKSGSMKGSYQMIDDNGTSFNIEIPEFFLVSPMALH